MVAGEAVAAHILPPWACQAVPAGSLTHLAPVAQPLRRADALWGRAVGIRTQDFARLRVYVFNQSPLGKIFGTHVFAVPASRECGLTCELPADSMDESGLLSMKNHELYPAYRFYVRMIKLWFLLFLPLSVGASCLSYRLSGSGKAAILTFGGCVFVVAVYGLLRNHFLRCPCCGKRSVTLRGESGCVLSTEWTLAPFEAYCRSCGKQMKTDLALKSNVFFKSIPTQVTAEQLEKLRHDTF